MEQPSPSTYRTDLLRGHLRGSRAVALAEGILVASLDIDAARAASLLREDRRDLPDGTELAAMSVLAWWALQADAPT